MAEEQSGSEGGLRETLERLRGENDLRPDPEAILAETMQIVSDCVHGVSVKALLTEIGPEFQSLICNGDSSSITDLLRLLGRTRLREDGRPCHC